MFKTIREWSSSFISPFAEALKEAFRVTLFSIPGQLILLIDDPELAEKTVVVNLILIFLRALDKYLFTKSRKEGARSDEAGGLSPI